MKTLPIGLLIFSILLPSILAADANIYEAGNFDKNPEQLAVLAERDIIRINWDGKDHQLHVRTIYLDKKKVDLTAFIEGSEVPFYTTITTKTSLQLNFDRDDIFDLKASIFNLIEEDGKKFVALKLEKLEKPQTISGGAIVQQENKAIKNYVPYILLGAGVALLIIIIVFFKRKTLGIKKE